MTIAHDVHDDLVTFHDGERDLVDSVGPFLVEGIRNGEIAVVIATEHHRRLFAEYLRDAGLPVDLLEDQGLYVSLDASAVLRSFMVDGMPQRERFREAIVPFANAASAKRRVLRAFGEMVGMLWKAGNVRAAVRLEQLWNEVVDAHGITLYGASSAVVADDDGDAPEADAPSDTVSKSFLPTPEALAAARWFVLSTLRAWEHSAFSVGAVSVATAQLVTSVLHNNLRPFRVTLRREIHGVRVEVEHPASIHDEAASDAHAALVHRLAAEWGEDIHADTKVVWATFAA